MNNRPSFHGISAKGYDEIYPFDQSKAIHGTPNADGLCGAFSNIFIISALQGTIPASFKTPDYPSLYNEAERVQDRMIAVEREQNGCANALGFYEAGKTPRSSYIATTDLPKTLEKSQAALMSYKTHSGQIHQLGFARFFSQCAVHDPNRFTGVAECQKAIQTVCEIIEKSQPDAVCVHSI